MAKSPLASLFDTIATIVYNGAMKFCKIKDCSRPQHGRGWCKMHHKRWLRHGSTESKRPTYQKRDPVCSIDGCGRSHVGRGYCALHYERFQRHGDPNKLVRREANTSLSQTVEWIMSNSKRASSGCFEFQRSREKKKGYGRLHYQGKVVGAHRLVLEHELGRSLRIGEQANHTCHNPKCVDPDHIYVGTQIDNIRDRVDAKRSHTILKESDVRMIRALAAFTRLKAKDFAEVFGVSPTTISAIIQRKRWTHV